MSYKIQGIDQNRWDNTKECVMKKLLRIKFAPQSKPAQQLLDTGNRHLAETGKNPFYACGMSITDRHILDHTKWVGNALGTLLSEIRLELQ